MLKRFRSGLLVAGLLVLSGLMWAMMFFGALAHLTRLAGGLLPFDVRLKGYSYAEARAFLENLRALALWWLTMPGRVREDPVPLKIRYALIAVPILMASLDLFENGCIAVMLWTWPHLSHRLIEVSSLATQVKIIAGVLTEALMGVLAVIWLMRWGIRRRA